VQEVVGNKLKQKIMSLDRYKTIQTSFENDIRDIKITTFIPKPTDSDYNNGFIRRYFIQKGNDKSSPILEVSLPEYEKMVRKPLYIGVTLKWRISGPISEIEIDSVLDKGVRESNRIAISLVTDKMPNLKIYLPNLLQFHE
jgi:hypothetical protein